MKRGDKLTYTNINEKLAIMEWAMCIPCVVDLLLRWSCGSDEPSTGCPEASSGRDSVPRLAWDGCLSRYLLPLVPFLSKFEISSCSWTPNDFTKLALNVWKYKNAYYIYYCRQNHPNNTISHFASIGFEPYLFLMSFSLSSSRCGVASWLHSCVKGDI